MRRLLLIGWIVLAAWPAMAALPPLGKWKIGAVRYHAPSRSRNPAIEKAMVRALEVPAGTAVDYLYDTVRLHDGGAPQVIVLLSGSYFCGTGGCMGLILDGAPRYRKVTAFTLMRPGWLVTSRRSNGWRDIVCHVSGGGLPATYVTLRFNGRTYPANPTMAPDLAHHSVLDGDAYLLEDEKAPGYGYLHFVAGR